MTLVQLQVFAAVVERGSFTAAAAALSMSQGAVSHSIAALEAELGADLLERQRSGVVCTPLGARIVRRARDMLAGAEQIRQEVAAARGIACGTVRVGSFPSVTARFMPGLLASFGQRYPGISVVLFEGTDDEVRCWIGDRTVDVGVVTLPCDEFESTPIATDRFVVILPHAHPLSQHASITVDRLADERFILSSSGCEAQIRRLFDARHCRPQVNYTVRDGSTIVAMVREGIGVSVVPTLTLPETLPGVRAVPVEPPALRRLALARPSGGAASPATRALVEAAHTWGTTRGFLPGGVDEPVPEDRR